MADMGLEQYAAPRPVHGCPGHADLHCPGHGPGASTRNTASSLHLDGCTAQILDH